MNQHITSILLGLLLIPSGAAADTFSDITNAIVGASPAIQAQKEAFRAQILASKAENTLDNPEIEFERLWNAGANGDNRWSAGVSQSFEWPGKYSARSKVVQAMAESNDIRMAELRTELTARVSKALIDYIEAARKAALLAEADSLLTSLQKATDKAYRHGESTILEVNRTAVEAAGISADYTEALSALSSRRADLEALGYNARTMPPLSCEIDFPRHELQPDESYISAALTSPTVKSAEAALKVAEAEANATRSGRYPGFSIGYRHAFEDGNHFNGISVGIELPLWRSGREMAAANADKMALSFQRQAAVTETTGRIRSLLNTVRGLNTRISLLAPPVENSNNQRLLLKAYQGGQISLLEYLRESAYFLEARLSLISLRAELARNATDLQALAPAN